jgi:hypothetical protein
MLHNHSHFAAAGGMPPHMKYILMFLGEPVYSSTNWLDVHQVALANGYAVNAMGCLFTLMPGVTINHVRTH